MVVLRIAWFAVRADARDAAARAMHAVATTMRTTLTDTTSRGLQLAATAILVCGCFVSPVMHFGEGKSAKESQHEQMAKETPHELEAPAEATASLRVEKIRVWADDDYRAQNMHWQHTFDDQLAYANEVLGPMLGIRLEAEYRSWDHRDP